MDTDDEDLINTPAGPVPRKSVHSVDPHQVVRRTPSGTYLVQKRPDSGDGGSAMPKELILTPGGARLKSLVHQIEPGTILDGSGGRHRKLHSSGRLLRDFGAIPYRTIGRPLMPRHVVHPPARVPALGSGWITYASWTNTSGTPISSFSTRWVVPSAPATQSGQLIYIFNGIQNSTMIYQPVLQWGNNGEFGGNNWCVASWYADGQGGQAFHSQPVDVNPGDALVGIMTLTAQSANGSSYNCEFQGIANSGLTIQDVEELTYCVETLECYGITQCSDYPDTDKTAMAAINIETGSTHPTVTWAATNSVTDCGQHTLLFDQDCSNNGEVDLWYRPSPFWTSGLGSIAPGEVQDWWFSWNGTGDVGPQLIQAEPLNESGELATTLIAESLDINGHVTYNATVRNNGSTAVNFQWRGGGR